MPVKVNLNSAITSFKDRFLTAPKMTPEMVKASIHKIMGSLSAQEKDSAYKKIAIFIHPDKPTPLYTKEEKTEFFKILHNIYRGEPQAVDPKLHAEIYAAVCKGDLRAVEDRVSKLNDPDQDLGNFKKPLLFEPVRTGDVVMVQMLLKKGISVSHTDQFGRTALHIAVRYNQLAVAEVLIAAQSNLNAVGIDFENGGGRALQIAKYYNYPEMIKLLERHTPKLWSFYKVMLLPALIAMGLSLCFFSIGVSIGVGVFVFVENCVFFSIKNYRIMVQPAYAVISTPNYSDVVFSSQEKELYEAIYNCDLKAVQACLRSGVNVNAQDRRGRSMLYSAVTVESDDMNSLNLIVNELIDAGAALDIKTLNGMTTLHHACLMGKLNQVRVLLEHGASVNIQDVLGQTPLHYVVRSKKNVVKMLELFLRYGVDVNIKNNADETPLDFAVRLGKSDIVELLKPHTPQRWSFRYSFMIGPVVGLMSLFAVSFWSACVLAFLVTAAAVRILSILNQKIDKIQSIVGKPVAAKVAPVIASSNSAAVFSSTTSNTPRIQEELPASRLHDLQKAQSS